MATETDPATVWDLLRRADDLVKYANNRGDPQISRDNARALLTEAATKLEDMSPGQREFFLAQIAIRLDDMKKAAEQGDR